MILKYPRTFHLPNSPGVTSGDKVIRGTSALDGTEVVITEKMDGECTTLYTNYMHARSSTHTPHESRNWLSRKHGEIGLTIPESWRVCGENLYARHSIAYEGLLSYFYIFSIWNEENRALNWDDTVEWAALLGFPTVKELYRGPFDAAIIESLPGTMDLEKQEGFVVRPARSFGFEEFNQVVAKWVRKGHVQTDKHWMHQAIVPNGLAPGVK